jgi:hypothetical protein
MAAPRTRASGASPKHPEPQPEPAAVPVEQIYPVEIRLQNAASSGEMVYHVNWRASTVLAYLNDQLQKVRIPVRAQFGHTSTPNIVRYVQMDAIAEVLIHNWPEVDSLPD